MVQLHMLSIQSDYTSLLVLPFQISMLTNQKVAYRIVMKNYTADIRFNLSYTPFTGQSTIKVYRITYLKKRHRLSYVLNKRYIY